MAMGPDEPERALGWQEFVLSADSLVQVSARVDTSPWTSIQISDLPGGIYLTKVEHRWLQPEKLSLSPSEQLSGRVLYKFEYHIIYSSTFQVPVLYFHICDQSGNAVALDWLWHRLPQHILAHSKDSQVSEDQLYSLYGQMITQTMHPISGNPFFMVHPCRTSRLMGQVLSCSHCQGQSEFKGSNPRCTYLITWLSSLAPVVGLCLPNEYAIELDRI